MWRSRTDPFFVEALEVIDERLEMARNKKHLDLKDYFHLQMAYTLLWSSIERYASLRWGFSRDKIVQRIKKLSEEESFRKALSGFDSRREVRKSDDPGENAKLNTKEQSGSAVEAKRTIDYYYQVRCNIVHRGKGSNVWEREVEHVLESRGELKSIFRSVLDATLGSVVTQER